MTGAWVVETLRGKHARDPRLRREILCGSDRLIASDAGLLVRLKSLDVSVTAAVVTPLCVAHSILAGNRLVFFPHVRQSIDASPSPSALPTQSAPHAMYTSVHVYYRRPKRFP